jgi:hypothetical protein
MSFNCTVWSFIRYISHLYIVILCCILVKRTTFLWDRYFALSKQSQIVLDIVKTYCQMYLSQIRICLLMCARNISYRCPGSKDNSHVHMAKKRSHKVGSVMAVTFCRHCSSYRRCWISKRVTRHTHTPHFYCRGYNSGGAFMLRISAVLAPVTHWKTNKTSSVFLSLFSGAEYNGTQQNRPQKMSR